MGGHVPVRVRASTLRPSAGGDVGIQDAGIAGRAIPSRPRDVQRAHSLTAGRWTVAQLVEASPIGEWCGFESRRFSATRRSEYEEAVVARDKGDAVMTDSDTDPQDARVADAKAAADQIVEAADD